LVENEWLAGQSEDQRRHLRSVAYRMLGSPSDADDAVRTLSSGERADKGDLNGANQAARTGSRRLRRGARRSRSRATARSAKRAGAAGRLDAPLGTLILSAGVRAAREAPNAGASEVRALC
jgi:hypothetical protein